MLASIFMILAPCLPSVCQFTRHAYQHKKSFTVIAQGEKMGEMRDGSGREDWREALSDGEGRSERGQM